MLCILQCDPLAAAAGAPCMEGSGATGVERRGKQESMGSGASRPHLCVQ